MYVFQNNTDQDMVLSYHTNGSVAHLSSFNEEDPYEVVLGPKMEIPRAVYTDMWASVEESIRAITE